MNGSTNIVTKTEKKVKSGVQVVEDLLSDFLNLPVYRLTSLQFFTGFTLKKNSNCAIYPSNTGPLLKLFNREIIIIHDTIFEDYPHAYHFWFSFLYRVFIPIMIKKRDHVLVPSRFVKARLKTIYQLPDDFISVVNWPSRFEKLPQPEKPDFHRPYYILSGNNSYRKNLLFIIEAIKKSFKSEVAFDILIPGPYQSNLGYLKIDKVTRIHNVNIYHVGYLSDDEYYKLLYYANGLVFPSLTEGYGLPVVECFQLGIPLMLSEIPVFKELSQNCPDVVFFNPLNRIDFLEKFESFIKSTYNKTRKESFKSLYLENYTIEKFKLSVARLLERIHTA